MSIRTNSDNVNWAIAYERRACIQALRRLKAEYASDWVCQGIVEKAIHRLQKRSKKKPAKEPSR